ncbi:NAD(P)/FAD-dependent oxidoreductase [Hugenholtzia roseola]|uniref:NAD(P)/FAD-dependent oxidoreductase n=1 Tax=Hugenholtzia roseola TaxID=1002 RepID=UPI0003F9832C|nr:FAD/NAD(P)-binding oxidoreductase [Hugenholtzia roseola]
MNQTHFQILIAGGGNAGIGTAAQLLRQNSQLKIGIIEPSDKHYYQPAWTLVGGGDYDINATVRPQSECLPKKATHIKARVTAFKPEENTVETDNGIFTYDYLIVALGIQLDWDKVKGLKENLGKNNISSNYTFQTAPYTFEALKTLKKGQTALFTNPNTPIKCGGAPQKIMYLAADYLRKQGILKDVGVHFYSAGGVIFGVKKYADTLNKIIARYGIQTHFKHNLIEIKGDEKKAIFVNENQEKVEVDFDMIHVTPPQSAPDVIKKSALAMPDNPLGWVEVDAATLQHRRFANVFSLGDAASTPNAKTGAAIRKQAPVLVQNLLALMQNQPLLAAYNGYGSCPLITGYGKLVLAEFDYKNEPTETFFFNQAEERLSMYWLKKYALPYLYWNKILKGTA